MAPQNITCNHFPGDLPRKLVDKQTLATSNLSLQINIADLLNTNK